MFDSVLVANRGEIAVRILRACRSMGLKTVAVYSEADRNAMHVGMADRSICIGPPAAGRSYLDPAALLFAAEICGAQAVHPGYGFLSENADFAQAVEDAGLTFVGPRPQSIRVMGDKVAAKQAMQEAGVPCVPGSAECLPEDPQIAKNLARKIGFPVILKAAGGGGGRGMRVVHDESSLPSALSLTREEARRAFSRPDVYLEKFLRRPRHVEIQVLCDSHGRALWLGSRDCSLQRRHQKLIEEAPAPRVDELALARLGDLCTQACLRLGYVGVGTFEFLYEDGEFFFIEMNTRLQVEHTVTEMITGVDLVEQQLRVARGEPLVFGQSDICISGHAIECRINAEDPLNFRPSPGLITSLQWPKGDGVRIDTHAEAGYRVTPHYDSLLGKVVVHGATREEALQRMQNALGDIQVEGIATNVALHRRLLVQPAFAAGGVDIHQLERWLSDPETP